MLHEGAVLLLGGGVVEEGVRQQLLGRRTLLHLFDDRIEKQRQGGEDMYG